MPASGVSDGGRVTAITCIDTVTSHPANWGNVWLAHMAISGQDFWQSFAGLLSGQHGMPPSAIFIDECVGIAAEASDACPSGVAIRPTMAPMSNNRERMDLGRTPAQ